MCYNIEWQTLSYSTGETTSWDARRKACLEASVIRKKSNSLTEFLTGLPEHQRVLIEQGIAEIEAQDRAEHPARYDYFDWLDQRQAEQEADPEYQQRLKTFRQEVFGTGALH
jgi:hypothetical protein